METAEYFIFNLYFAYQHVIPVKSTNSWFSKGINHPKHFQITSPKLTQLLPSLLRSALCGSSRQVLTTNHKSSFFSPNVFTTQAWSVVTDARWSTSKTARQRWQWQLYLYFSHRQNRIRPSEGFLQRKTFNCFAESCESEKCHCWKGFLLHIPAKELDLIITLCDRSEGTRSTITLCLLRIFFVTFLSGITPCRSHSRDPVQDWRNIVTGTAKLQWHHPLKTNGYYSKTYGRQPHVQSTPGPPPLLFPCGLVCQNNCSSVLFSLSSSWIFDGC